MDRFRSIATREGSISNQESRRSRVYPSAKDRDSPLIAISIKSAPKPIPLRRPSLSAFDQASIKRWSRSRPMRVDEHRPIQYLCQPIGVSRSRAVPKDPELGASEARRQEVVAFALDLEGFHKLVPPESSGA